MNAHSNRKTTPPRVRHTREDVFVAEYLKDLNATRAAIRAGYSPETARSIAAELMQKDRVAEKVSAAFAARAKRAEIEADQILLRWWELAEADPSELITIEKQCCRFCWGKKHKYQWTPIEFSEAVEKFKAEQAAAQTMKEAFTRVFDGKGGVGYNRRLPPNPDCPECFGYGLEHVEVRDLRDVSPSAKRLLAGVERTKDGLKIKMRDQDAARLNVAKHLGMLDKKVTHANDKDNPLPPAIIGLVAMPSKAIEGTDDPG